MANGSPVMAIPKELWRMVDYLWPDKGVEGEEEVIRDMLDEGKPFPAIESE